jgi:beta-xylosidase
MLTNDGSAQAEAPWRDTSRSLDERVEDLLARMTLRERLAQLFSAWVNASESPSGVAPLQNEFIDATMDWHRLIESGLGQITRPFGTAPVEPAEGVRWLAKLQSDVVSANRFGIPALAHEECLTGLTAWRATINPTPLAWGATFDPDLVERMAAAVGEVLRSVGVHQGLAPVLDVVRDPRWGRTEETIGEDPYLVGTIGTAYVKGLQSAGIVATGKHFVGYSGSRAGRNFAPVTIGPRELADVLLPPFEMAVHAGGLRSMMHSYAEIDGIPPASDERLFTDLLRGVWGFTGTVVADYFGISFLESLHGVAGSPAQAAAQALRAGVDVELPAVRCFGEPLHYAVQSGLISEELVDRAVRRVLRQKAELGLLDPDWTPMPQTDDEIDFDPPAARDLARRVAEESVVLLSNNGTLPLRKEARVALIGPRADDVEAMMGCYTFPRHVGLDHPELPVGVPIKTVREALADEGIRVAYHQGCEVQGADMSGFADAVAAAREAEVCVLALGDVAGLFGRGTSGEGCDVADLRLPGPQEQLLEAILATGTPVVLVLLSGRPYALGGQADRLAAIVQAFFPGEEGGPAVAGVLAGRVCPSGRLPVSMPRSAGGQPTTYLAPLLGHVTQVSTVDPTPLFPFGHGLSYTAFEWSAPSGGGNVGTHEEATVSVMVRNTGDRAGAEVVQLYLHDPVAQVTRPRNRLIGYARVALEPGHAATVSFGVHADLSSFTGRDGRRVVESGDLQLRFGASSGDIRHAVPVRLIGPEREVDHHRRLFAAVTVSSVDVPVQAGPPELS